MYLNCKTYFSFCYGTFRTEELVQTAAVKGVTSLALTNINSTWDTWDFVKHCREAGIRPIAGAEVRNGDQLLYLLLAAGNEGLHWIHTFLSAHLMEKKDFPARAEQRPFFDKPSDGFVIYPFGAKPLDELFINERIGVKPADINKLYTIDPERYAHRLVVQQPVTVQDKKRHNLHRLLRAIDKNTLLSKLPAACCADADETFRSPTELQEAFKRYPGLVANTYRLMEACHIEMDFGVDKNKQPYNGTKEDDRALLEKLAWDGFQSRYDEKNKEAAERLAKELKIINDSGFNSYFLINYDIIRYARSRGFYYVGRGSGANSIVAYCLRITDVDPVRLNLYFERFLNPYRIASPPDFDIDFSWRDRDEMINYIFQKYGSSRVALLGACPTFRSDSAIRELGKVFGLPEEEIRSLQSVPVPTDKIHQLILRYGNLLKGFPRSMSIHACGMLISEKPVLSYTTLFRPPKGLPTAMLDMFVAEEIGMNKFDILSQRGLGHIRDALQFIKDNHSINIDIHNVPAFMNDAAIAEKIKNADTTGCFYIESPAMRQLLKKLKCCDYLTLVAASSIIRPGVAQSGMMRAYIQRYHNPGSVKYPHPLFEEHLSETFGVMVFQEDVIKIAHYFAGLNLGEADILRRAMSGKYRTNNEFQMMREKFMLGCKNKGHSEALSAEVWRQMESFAGYSFNKAHSASYAVESYQSLFLKTYYPKEFMVAVINNGGGFYNRELYFLELRKTGANIELPCVNRSGYTTHISGNDVYMGLSSIKSLEASAAEKILEERRLNGPYPDIRDLIERTKTAREQLNVLISAGAFRFTGKSKKTLLWEANFLQKKSAAQPAAAGLLFRETPTGFTLPDFRDLYLDDLYDQMELLGFPLANPFDMSEEDPHQYIYARDLKSHLGKTVTLPGYFIDHKIVSARNHATMCLGTFVDVNLDWIDTVHFPECYKRYPLKGKGFYRITGKVTEDLGVYSIEVQRLYKTGYKPKSYAAYD